MAFTCKIRLSPIDQMDCFTTRGLASISGSATNRFWWILFHLEVALKPLPTTYFHANHEDFPEAFPNKIIWMQIRHVEHFPPASYRFNENGFIISKWMISEQRCWVYLPRSATLRGERTVDDKWLWKSKSTAVKHALSILKPPLQRPRTVKSQHACVLLNLNI